LARNIYGLFSAGLFHIHLEYLEAQSSFLWAHVSLSQQSVGYFAAINFMSTYLGSVMFEKS